MPEANVGRKRDTRRMQARRGDRSGNGTTREDVGGGKRESRCATVCEGKDERSGEPRERRHPRAHFRFGTVEGNEKGRRGGVNSRDINSVLALGGLQRRKLRAEGEYYPPFSVSPLDQRSSHPSVVFPFLSPSVCPPPPPRPPTQNHPRRARVGEALQIRD